MLSLHTNKVVQTLDIAIHLMNAFREIVSKLDWLDEETKKLARTKINAMSLKIGYPGFILHEVELSARYADIEIDPDLYFENMLSVLRVRIVSFVKIINLFYFF